MIVRSFFKKKERAEPKQERLEVDESLLSALIRGEAVDTMEKALQIPEIAGGVQLIANKIAALPVRLYRKKKDETVEIADDYRVRLINLETGSTMDGNQFKKAMIMDYFLGKGGYAFVNWDGNIIKSIHYVKEQDISFIEGTDPIFRDYEIMVQGQKYEPYQFIRLLRNSRDGIKGTSVVDQNSRLMAVVYNSLKYEENLVAKGGNKKGFLKSAKKLTDQAMDKLREAWNNLYSNNKENVVILNEGMEFQEASNTSVEMQLNENKKTNGDQICKILNMPPAMLNGGATENDDKNFVKYGLMDAISDFESALNRSLLLEKEKGKMFWQFDVTELTKGDIDKRYNAYSVGIEKGFLQTDEVRKRENLPPLDMNFVKLGLQDGLYDPKSKTVYVLNTNKAVCLDDLKPTKGGEKQGELNSGKNPSLLTDMSTPSEETVDQSETEGQENDL